MWFSENERKGFMTCTPAGYKVVALAGWIGALGWLQFLLLVVVLIAGAITRWFEFPTLWLFAVPLGFRFVAQGLDRFGRSLATRKSFEYHYKPDFASWLEGDARRTYPPHRDTDAASAGSASSP